MAPDQIEAMAYALKADPVIVKTVAESAWAVARRELRKELAAFVNEEMSKLSGTGYGKAQRTFGKRIVTKIMEGN